MVMDFVKGMLVILPIKSVSYPSDLALISLTKRHWGARGRSSSISLQVREFLSLRASGQRTMTSSWEQSHLKILTPVHCFVGNYIPSPCTSRSYSNYSRRNHRRCNFFSLSLEPQHERKREWGRKHWKTRWLEITELVKDRFKKPGKSQLV